MIIIIIIIGSSCNFRNFMILCDIADLEDYQFTTILLLLMILTLYIIVGIDLRLLLVTCTIIMIITIISHYNG